MSEFKMFLHEEWRDGFKRRDDDAIGLWAGRFVFGCVAVSALCFVASCAGAIGSAL